MDEIQASVNIIPYLRYFYEEIPGLHVIAAGSLLDFTLYEHSFSMPVGRIEYMHLGPLTFFEYLNAIDESKLVDYLESCDVFSKFPESIHTKSLQYLRHYMVTGGMPAVINAYIQNGDYLSVRQEQQSILHTYEDDFSKYGQKVNISLLQKNL